MGQDVFLSSPDRLTIMKFPSLWELNKNNKTLQTGIGMGNYITEQMYKILINKTRSKMFSFSYPIFFVSASQGCKSIAYIHCAETSAGCSDSLEYASLFPVSNYIPTTFPI